MDELTDIIENGLQDYGEDIGPLYSAVGNDTRLSRAIQSLLLAQATVMESRDKRTEAALKAVFETEAEVLGETLKGAELEKAIQYLGYLKDQIDKAYKVI